MSDHCSRCGEERPWVLGSLCSQCANGGGPAFPKPRDPYPNCDNDTYPSQATGMSVRDWFAGRALPHALDEAILALMKANVPKVMEKDVAAAAAGRAYLIADAMLAERDRK